MQYLNFLEKHILFQLYAAPLFVSADKVYDVWKQLTGIGTPILIASVKQFFSFLQRLLK
jgi:hypothetical protein